MGLEALASSFFVAIRVEGRQDRRPASGPLAAVLGYGCGLALWSPGPRRTGSRFSSSIENGVNLIGGGLLALAKTDFTG